MVNGVQSPRQAVCGDIRSSKEWLNRLLGTTCLGLLDQAFESLLKQFLVVGFKFVWFCL